MTELEKELIKYLEKEGFPTLSYMGVSIKDMTRNELELLCIWFGCQSMRHEPLCTKPILKSS